MFQVLNYWQETFMHLQHSSLILTANGYQAKQYEINVDQTGYRFKDVIYTKVPGVKWFLLYIECIRLGHCRHIIIKFWL